MTNSTSSLLWIIIVIPDFKTHNIIMSARVYFMKMVNGCKRCVYNVSARWTLKTDKFTLFVNVIVLLSTTVCAVKTNKQIVNITDETLTGYSFLSRYHYTISKNYLKRWYRIRHWIPMFFGTPFSIRKQIGRQHKDLLQRRGIYFFEELIQMIFKDLGKHGKFYTKLASLFTL